MQIAPSRSILAFYPYFAYMHQENIHNIVCAMHLHINLDREPIITSPLRSPVSLESTSNLRQCGYSIRNIKYVWYDVNVIMLVTFFLGCLKCVCVKCVINHYHSYKIIIFYPCLSLFFNPIVYTDGTLCFDDGFMTSFLVKLRCNTNNSSRALWDADSMVEISSVSQKATE